MAGASKSIVINAPMEKVFALITNYEAYKDFIPEVRGVNVLERAGNEATVQYEAEIIKRIKYTLRHTAQPPNRLTWSFVKGDMMKDNKGSWELVDQGGGKTHVTYTIEIGLGALVPRAIVDTLIGTSLPKLLENFKAAAEKA
jgi:ribosome-associated toxin RatA of RatAB toxin-antitoxin module